MINLTELTNKDIECWVEYAPKFRMGTNNRSGLPEKGRLKGWNQTFIFVVYNCVGNWNIYQSYTAAATHPRELEFIEIKEER